MTDETKPAVIIPDAPTHDLEAMVVPATVVPPPAAPPTLGEVLDQLDAATARAVLAEAHLHDLEVKLNERDAEIVLLNTERDEVDAQLLSAKTRVAELEARKVATFARPAEVTCPTCGTRIGA